MKLSLNWLQEFINLNDSAENIGEKITIHTAELEEVIHTDDLFSQITIGTLLKFEPHPSSDKLNIGTFKVGDCTVQIVFGDVHPLSVGTAYPIALDGAKLPNNVHIKSGKIKGILSEGMVCHNGELGMKNTELLTFSADIAGKKLSEFISDTLFDIDNKSLTHRPDLMGHTGFVRELQTIYKIDENCVPKFELPTTNSDQKVVVNIQTPNCRRFMAVQCNNINVETSNIQTMFRLESLGTRAISNIVDITNLSLLGLGQPMHAFDADKIKGAITVRMAKDGEKLLALDENEYELTTDDIVIADEEKVLSIAGIMGGLASAVTNNTKNIVFESANFNSTVIRKTSARLGLRSESSMRFEKTLDPENCEQGLAFALQKLTEICPNSNIQSTISDEYPHPYPTKKVELPLSLINQYAGTNIPKEFVLETLHKLGFPVTETNQTLMVEIPSWRTTKDVSIQPDIIEEVIRMFGYHNIENQLPTLPIRPPKKNKIRSLEWKIRDFWSQNNFYEVMLSSFVSAEDEDFMEDESHIKTINGNSETTRLRKTLVSNLLKNLEPELRTHHEIQIFELGHTYHGFENEPHILATMVASLSQKNTDCFFDLQSQIFKFLQTLAIPKDLIEFTPNQTPNSISHPYQTANILVQGQLVGTIFTLHPSKNTIKNSAITVSEINIETLHSIVQNIHTKFQTLSDFPVVQRDISVVVSKKTLMKDLIKTMRNTANNLEQIDLFDEFEDEAKIGKDLKNLAFHLQFQSKTETLTGEFIESQMQNIAQALSENHHASIR